MYNAMQIKQCCPNTPWLLVGMKGDLRTSDNFVVLKSAAIQLATDFGKYK